MSAPSSGVEHNTLEAALELAELGYRVVPVCWPGADGRCACGQRHDKRPENDVSGKAPLLGPGWQALATTDATQIRAWWDRWPSANVGLLTPDDVLVVDLDHAPGRGKTGPEDVLYLEQEHGELPPGPRDASGGGGGRLFFRLPPGVTLDDLRPPPQYPGIELRKRGQTVVAPSLHRSGGRYRWLSPLVRPEALPTPPAWLLALLRKPAPDPTAKPATDDVEGRLAVLLLDPRFSRAWNYLDHDGDRSTEDYGRACELVKRGLSDADGAEMLKHAPPNPKARSGTAKAMDSHGYGLRTMAKARQDVCGRTAPAVVAPQHSRLNGSGPVSKPAAAPSILVLPADEFCAQEWPQRPALLSPWILERSICLVYAEAGVGKSHLVHSVALSVAGGSILDGPDSFGWTVPQPRKVLLVDGELPAADLTERLRAWWPAADLPQNLMVASDDANGAGGIPSLLTPDGRAALEPHLDGVALLVLDNTSTLLTSEGDQNAAESWQEAQDWLVSLRRRGIAVLLVDHAGKTAGRGPRGTSRKLDVVDVVLELSHPPAWQASDGCAFRLKFHKDRIVHDERSAPRSVRLESGADGALSWRVRLLMESAMEEGLDLLRQGMAPREVAEAAGVSLATVYRWKDRAKGRP